MQPKKKKDIDEREKKNNHETRKNLGVMSSRGRMMATRLPRSIR
jgi:hypothetical protein